MLFFGGVNLSRSTDGGVTWTLVNYWWDYYEDIENKLHADIPEFHYLFIITKK